MWEPMEDFCIRFVDKSGENRDEDKLDEMIKRINEVVNEYDFGVKTYSGLKCFYELLKGEEHRAREADKFNK